MAKTSTRVVKWQSLHMRGEGAVVVAKLMMACNDMQYANASLKQWKTAHGIEPSWRNRGRAMYFIRLQIGHVFEGLKIIANIKEDGILSSLVKSCDPQTRDSFSYLETCLRGGSKHKEIEQLFGQVRHNLTFHYEQSGKLLAEALNAKAIKPEGCSLIERGDSMDKWDFRIANELVDEIVVKRIWKVPETDDLRSEADRCAARIHEITVRFLDFAGEFIWLYCES